MRRTWLAIGLITAFFGTQLILGISGVDASSEREVRLERRTVSEDGRFFVYASADSDEVPGEDNDATDVFLVDRQLGASSRISVNSLGEQGDGDSESPVISGDGKYVAFESLATNLDVIRPDENGVRDVFLRDLASGLTFRVSEGLDGEESKEPNLAPSISTDGRYIGFTSLSQDEASLENQDGAGTTFVHDRVARQTQEESTDPSLPLTGSTTSLPLEGTQSLEASSSSSEGPCEREVRVTSDTSPTSTRFFPQHALSVGSDHSLVTNRAGEGYAWGANWDGQIGDGTFTSRTTPRKIATSVKLAQVAGGASFSLALESNLSNHVWAWGDNWDGELGQGSYNAGSAYPLRVQELAGVVEVAAGDYHALALRSNGTVCSWGANWDGQLGDGTTDNSATPTFVIISSDPIVQIAAGAYHSMALDSAGKVWAWGYNFFGQLGDGTKQGRIFPVRVGTLSGVVAIAAGGYHSLAIKADGTAWAWGDNFYGQLGDGTTTTRLSPVKVSNLASVMEIEGGDLHSIAVTRDGKVSTWGRNYNGQLGDGTTTDRKKPVQVIGGAAFEVGAGDDHSVALLATTGKPLRAWGLNWDGQVGDGTTTGRLSPVTVSFTTDIGEVPAYEYVAFGDSLTTGYSNPDCDASKIDRNLSPYGCNENNLSPTVIPYPEWVESRNAGLELKRVGIWGYRASHGIAAAARARNDEGEWRPQFESVIRAKEVVTGALGINDMNWSDFGPWFFACSPDLQYDAAACQAYANERLYDFEPELARMMHFLSRAKLNGALVVIPNYYIAFANKTGCETVFNINKTIVSTVNSALSSQAGWRGLQIANVYSRFGSQGEHGADSGSEWVFGTECNTAQGVLLAGLAGAGSDSAEAELKEKYDPHPNLIGSAEIAITIDAHIP